MVGNAESTHIWSLNQELPLLLPSTTWPTVHPGLCAMQRDWAVILIGSTIEDLVFMGDAAKADFLALALLH